MNNVILTILVIALSFVLGMVISHSMSARKKKAEITTDFLESKLSECSDLTTCSLEYVNLVKYKEGSLPLLTRRSFSMIYSAVIRAGIDLSMAEVSVTPQKITVRLPETTIQSIDVDTDSLRFYDEHNALFNWNDKEDISEAIKAARKDVEQNADLERLKNQAHRQAVLVVTKLIEPLAQGREIETA